MRAIPNPDTSRRLKLRVILGTLAIALPLPVPAQARWQPRPTTAAWQWQLTGKADLGPCAAPRSH